MTEQRPLNIDLEELAIVHAMLMMAISMSTNARDKFELDLLRGVVRAIAAMPHVTKSEDEISTFVNMCVLSLLAEASTLIDEEVA